MRTLASQSENYDSRKTAQLNNELLRLDIDVAALSETRLLDCGKIREKDYTIFWCGRKDFRREGVGFAIRNTLLGCCSSPVSHSSRITSISFNTRNGIINLVGVYAPTLDTDDSEKDEFYDHLEQILRRIPQSEYLVVLGDFNARVGRESDRWPHCVGGQGVGKLNANGQRVLELCSSMSLCVTNTYFANKLCRKTSWRHPRSGHWHQIDLILTRRRDLKHVLCTRSYQSADCDTDHSLVMSKVKFELKRFYHSKKSSKSCINVLGLRNPSKRRLWGQKMENVVSDAENSQQAWDTFRDSMYSVSLEVLGVRKRKNQDWFEENAAILSPLLEDKRAAVVKYRKAATRSNLSALRSKRNAFLSAARDCANKFWNDLCNDIQVRAECGDIKGMYDGIKRAIGPTKKQTAPLLSIDGHLIYDREKVMERWVDHYQDLYGDDSNANLNVMENLPQYDVDYSLDVLPTFQDLREVCSQMPNNKSPGLDGLPAELFKNLSDHTLLKFYEVIKLCWQEGSVPRDFRDAKFIQIYKNKGNRNSCDSYRGISLLNIAGKILARLLLPRLQKLGERVYPESQAGFRSGRSTIDMIFSLRQLQEKCREKQLPLYVAFVDLKKAFDSVNRAGLYKILSKIGCPPNLLSLIRSLHDGMMARVSHEGDESKSFPVRNGVKQGCVLAPTLFNIVFSFLLSYANLDEDDGVFLRCRTSGGLFNVRRFRALTMTVLWCVRELLFADDAAFVSHNAVSLQEMLNKFSEACSAFGLTVSSEKTVVLQQGVDLKSDFYINGNKLLEVDQFCYLGSIVTADVDIDTEVSARISKAARTFGCLRDRAWSNNKLTIKTKINIYNACILSTLLYGVESWTLYSKQLSKLNGFHCRCLRKLLNINWQERVTNVEVLERTGSVSVHTLVRRRRLRWVGHVVRMENNRIPKKILYSEVSGGGRRVGRPNLRFLDVIKRDVNECGARDWEADVADRVQWRRKTEEVCDTGEKHWIESERRKRALRHARRVQMSSNARNGQ